jgi:uncharacterized protein YjbJ (UPF0337 family)
MRRAPDRRVARQETGCSPARRVVPLINDEEAPVSKPKEVAGATKQAAGKAASTAKDEARQVRASTASAAGDVTGVAKDQVGTVAGEALDDAKDLWQQTLAQVNEQAGSFVAKLGQSVGSVADELHAMGDGTGDGQGPVADLARALAARGDDISELLTKQGPDGLLRELRRYAGRSPGTFLLGALAAGVAAGRLTRGAKAAQPDDASATAAPTSAAPSNRSRR